MRTHAPARSAHRCRAQASACAVIAFLVMSAPAVAHHSGAGFNSDKVIELTGTIKEFQFTNPHTWIQVIVEDDKGAKVEWSVEWGSPNSLGRQGIRPSTFPAGAKVAMRLRPMLNGAPAGAFVGAKFPDGRTVGRWE
jgi:uncharacterized protein DUF6152